MAALGAQMPPTTTGRALPVLRTGFARPRVVMLLVLDGMRRDYFDRYAASMATLAALRSPSKCDTRCSLSQYCDALRSETRLRVAVEGAP